MKHEGTKRPSGIEQCLYASCDYGKLDYMVLELSVLVAPKEKLYFFPALPPVFSSVPLSLNHTMSLPFSSTSTMVSLAGKDIH